MGKILRVVDKRSVLIDFSDADVRSVYDNFGLYGDMGPVELLSMNHIKPQLDGMMVDFSITPEELIAKILEEYCE